MKALVIAVLALGIVACNDDDPVARNVDENVVNGTKICWDGSEIPADKPCPYRPKPPEQLP